MCLSQGSSYESHTGGLDSRRLCGPGGYLSWTRCDKRSLRPSYRVAIRSDVDSEHTARADETTTS